MLQSVAYVAGIRNGNSGWNGADRAVTGQHGVDRIRAVGVGRRRGIAGFAANAPQLSVVAAEADRAAWALL